MEKMICRLMAASLTLVSLSAVAAVDFNTAAKYAAACEAELGYAATDVPSVNCNDGLVFNSANDRVGHARIEPKVDLVFACRHLSTDGFSAVSIELLIHNRESGSTCFFVAKDSRLHPAPGTDPVIFADFVSPTSKSADSYWKSFPFLCVDCHVAGPYIASPAIAPALAQFGLLNDGHDTFATRYHSVGSDPSDGKHSSGMPSTSNPFSDWDPRVMGHNEAITCAAGCHSIGTRSIHFDPRFPAPAILDAEGNTLIPSLTQDIADVVSAGVMPVDAYAISSSDYRWVNMDVPDNRGDYEEAETLSGLKELYPRFYCSNPTSLSAHVVDSDEVMNTSNFPDTFNRFNLQDGLVCLNKDQASGRCQNYQTRYLCNGHWTAWQGNDNPDGSGDWETRNGFTNLCANPTGIQARYKTGNVYIVGNGPPDRLVEFDNKGLICHNQDQNNGMCSNYVVRFECQLKTSGIPTDNLVIGGHSLP